MNSLLIFYFIIFIFYIKLYCVNGNNSLDKMVSDKRIVLDTGVDYSIFVPYNNVKDKYFHLISPPDKWIHHFNHLFSRLNTISYSKDPIYESLSNFDKSTDAYFRFLQSFLTGHSFGTAEKTASPALFNDKSGKISIVPFNSESRNDGADWAYLGVTMTGNVRILFLEKLLIDVIKNNVVGAFMETGVWRGGSSIFARGVIRAFNEQESRISYVCDSFRGLPHNDHEIEKLGGIE
jgi:hypothetical protein